jgi:hypothetical protein
MLSSYSSGLERGRRMAGGGGVPHHNGSGWLDGAESRRITDHRDGTEELS